ncbi:MAG: DUF547 domain-containing protein [Bacteroidota bacterium]
MSPRYLFPFFLFAVFFSDGLSAQSTATFFQEADSFFGKYAVEGKVAYQKIDKKELAALTTLIRKIDFTALSEREQKAYLINVYNILVIKAVKEQYPIASPNEVTGFFDWKKYTVGGKKLTLNGLEKEFLLKKYQDPRLHFVLVCAAKGCPAIIPKAYLPETLEAQLNQQTQLALNDENFIYTKSKEKTAYLSQIFRWYPEDFKVAGDIRTFINLYREATIPGDFKLRYYDYDWQLNDANPVRRSGNPAFFRASRLLRKKQFELKIFNSLYTQQQYDGFSNFNSRSSYFSSFFQYLIGSEQRFNVGVDFVLRSQIVNDLATHSPFLAIQTKQFDEFRNTANGEQLQSSEGTPIQTSGRFGASHIGPKIKVHPFQKNRNFSLQQTLYVPIDQEVDGQFISFTQLFYDKLIGTQTQLFVEASLWSPLQPTFRVDPFFKVFYSYFPTSRWTVYGMVGLPSEVGVGTKYLVAKNFEIELLYTNYALQRIAIKDRVAQTFNLGFRFMR